MSSVVFDVLGGVGVLVLMIVALEIGFRCGRYAVKKKDAPASGQIGAVQGAILGLLGLLLAFSFSAAGARFLERQDLIVTEANAIGTAYLRADLLPDHERDELREALRTYTEHRIEVSAGLRNGITRETLTEFDTMHNRIWETAIAGVARRPELALAVLNPINEVIDLHSTRLAAARKHVPLPVLGLLFASSMLAVATIGFGAGMTKRRSGSLLLPLVLLISMALWITMDLDHPRAGILRLSDAPLKALRFDAPQPASP